MLCLDLEALPTYHLQWAGLGWRQSQLGSWCMRSSMQGLLPNGVVVLAPVCEQSVQIHGPHT